MLVNGLLVDGCLKKVKINVENRESFSRLHVQMYDAIIKRRKITDIHLSATGIVRGIILG